MSQPRELVVLVNEEFVGERGTVKVVWLVAHNDGFVAAGEFPGARTQRLEAGPRVVWRTRIELDLARGTPLVRVETRPGTAKGSTLAHLTGRARPSRARVVRKSFVVGARGEPLPAPRSGQTE